MKTKTFFMLPIIVPIAILAWLVMGFSMLLYKIQVNRKPANEIVKSAL